MCIRDRVGAAIGKIARPPHVSFQWVGWLQQPSYFPLGEPQKRGATASRLDRPRRFSPDECLDTSTRDGIDGASEVAGEQPGGSMVVTLLEPELKLSTEYALRAVHAEAVPLTLV